MTSVNIPGVMSATPFIEVHNSYGNADTVINVGISHLQFMCIEIMQKEIAQAQTRDPTVDWGKVNEMINAGDAEMRNLGYAILDEHTGYCSRILRNIGDKYNLENVVKDYLMRNIGNVTGKIK